MKTQISHFCKEYVQVLKPLRNAFQHTMDRVEEGAMSEVMEPALAGLADLRHRFTTLFEKVEGQEAYLLIFGPLKSGKSTLMNALCGAYVSEVTCMPAYPCLVFVGWGDRAHTTVMRYNGRKSTFTDSAMMQALIQDAHTSLAYRIREVESNGDRFEPGSHFPEAIRRIDIKLPVRGLKESGTVLVDTPGLYSRMKFGYDLMTREFRNSAACAVFVVKTDNLFLDHVFSEFNELLNLFSRIFLVVNIDTHKRDLQPDGTLRPSLESQQPGKIIEAFQSYAMSDPLRKAHAEGRLRIYPIDLLSAASVFLKHRETEREEGQKGVEKEAAMPSPAPLEKDSEKEAEKETAAESAYAAWEARRKAQAQPQMGEGGEGEKKEAAIDPLARAQVEEDKAANVQKEVFDSFVRDLTEYLNSSDYLTEFMRDSLKQGGLFCREIREHVESEALAALKEQKLRLDREMQEVLARLDALEKVESASWSTAFEKANEENQKRAEALSGKVEGEVGSQLGKALDEWLESDDSLGSLGERWNALLRETMEKVHNETKARLERLAETATGGAELSPDLVRRLDRLGLDLGPIQQAAMAEAQESSKAPAVGMTLRSHSIVVRKSLLDWILFRGQPKLRQRLFGAEEQLDLAIPVKVKKKRLQGEGENALRRMAESSVTDLLPSVPRRQASELIRNYRDRFLKKLNQELERIGHEIQEDRKQVNERLAENADTTAAFQSLIDRSAELSGAIRRLGEKFQSEAQ